MLAVSGRVEAAISREIGWLKFRWKFGAREQGKRATSLGLCGEKIMA